MNPRLAVWLVNGLLATLAAFSLFPLLWMLSASFMAPGASTSLPTPILPSSPTLENYRTLFGSIATWPGITRAPSRRRKSASRPRNRSLANA